MIPCPSLPLVLFVSPETLPTLWLSQAGEAHPALWGRQSQLWLFRCTSHPSPYSFCKSPQPRKGVCQDPWTCRLDCSAHIPPSSYVTKPARSWYLLCVTGRDLLEALTCLPKVDVFSTELLLEELLQGRESCWSGGTVAVGQSVSNSGQEQGLSSGL